tara:strand:+ start:7550 stop:8935 length:1386 start_codon:yes stop_codon:yes gene_type:complete
MRVNHTKISVLILTISSVISSCSITGRSTFGLYNKIFKKEIEIKKDRIPGSYSTITTPVVVPSENLNLEKSYVDVFTSSSSKSLHHYQLSIMEGRNSYFDDIRKNNVKSMKVIRGDENCVVKNFRITEDPRPLAMSIILDHSGSMGDVRANMLQESLAHELINKRKEDEFSIFKFSTFNNMLSRSKSSSVLSNSLLPSIGLYGYGKSTSLLDAIGAGMEEVLKSENERKVVLVFTDGVENTSYNYTFKQLIDKASKQGISVITCGFGYFVNNRMLYDLSSETGGYHYNLYDRREYEAFFNTILHRLNNNIEVSFSPCMFGDNMKVEIGVEFNGKKKNLYLPLNHPLKKESVIELNVYFDTNKHSIKKQYHDELNRVATFLKQYPTIVVEIGGHTDSDADTDYNQELSKKRAESIKNYLIKKGVNKNQMVLRGYGETSPKYPNTSDWNKSLNRRSEVKIITL